METTTKWFETSFKWSVRKGNCSRPRDMHCPPKWTSGTSPAVLVPRFNFFTFEVQMQSREPEAKWIKCGRSPPRPQQRVTSAVVPKRSNSLVQTLKGMVNVFPKNRLPKFAFNDDLEKEVMEGVLR